MRKAALVMALGLGILVIVACGAANSPSGSSNSAPNFIEVGQEYTFWLPGGGGEQGKVLEVVDDGWILVEGTNPREFERSTLVKRGEQAWVNTTAIIMIHRGAEISSRLQQLEGG